MTAAMLLVAGAVVASALPNQSNPSLNTSTLNPELGAESTSLYCVGISAAGWATLRVTSPQGIISTLYSGGNGYARLASPTLSGTTLAWLSALDHNGPVRVMPVQGKNVPVTFTYFKGRRAISTTLKASAGIPVNAPDGWLDATYGIVSAGTPMLMQGVVGANGLESGLNGR